MVNSDLNNDFSNTKIAIVDDNRNFLHIMRSVLRSFGVRSIYETVSAYQALEHLRAHEIDILMTDNVMPEIDGLELISLIRNDRRLIARAVPIICVSGYSERRNIEAAVRAGADDFLVKPVRPADVYKRVAKQIESPIPRIEVAGYFGPDRRRGFTNNHGGANRRLEVTEV